MPETWVEAKTDWAFCRQVSERCGVSPLVARLLAHGLGDEGSIGVFLGADSAELPDPSRLPCMDGAVERLCQALARGERMLVHGDYDVDGLMGTAILVAGLSALGGSVSSFIPSRFEGGYGLSDASLSAAERASASLVVTADCGTNAEEAGERLKQRGVDLLVTDHHIPKPGTVLPHLFVNPRAQVGHPDSELCGASVAMQVVRALGARLNRRLPEQGFLRLAAIATVADVVPVTTINRAICRRGLGALSQSPSPALAALIQAAGILPPIRSCHVGFGLAPRFNAAGRMEHAGLVVSLLLEKDPAKALEQVRRLEHLNQRRKAQQMLALELASPQVSCLNGERAVFASLEGGAFRGVVGPVAARLAEKYHRSAFVVAWEGEEGTGSARGVDGDNLMSMLASASGHMVRYGGHESAAGFTLKRERWPDFTTTLLGVPAPLQAPKDPLFHRLGPGEVERIWDAWGILDPFGPGNEEPSLALEGLVPERVRVFKDRHLAWDATLPSGRKLTLISWDALSQGMTPASASEGKLFVGKPVPESRPRDLPFYFLVKEVIG